VFVKAIDRDTATPTRSRPSGVICVRHGDGRVAFETARNGSSHEACRIDRRPPRAAHARAAAAIGVKLRGPEECRVRVRRRCASSVGSRPAPLDDAAVTALWKEVRGLRAARVRTGNSA